MTGCLLVLVLVTYVAGILYSWIDSKFQNNANDLAAAAEAGSQTEESTQEVVKTYTQEEVDALIAEAKQQAEDEEENKILSGIRDGLTSGTTMVETLRPYYPNELVVVSNGTFNFVPIRDDLQKNDYVLENLNILEDGEVQYMQDGQVVSHTDSNSAQNCNSQNQNRQGRYHADYQIAHGQFLSTVFSA